MATKVVFGLFSAFVFATNCRMPNHRIRKDATFTEHVANRSHKVNELCDSTLNKVHHMLFLTDVCTNECFAFRDTMKQEDKLSFVDAMEKEILDH